MRRMTAWQWQGLIMLLGATGAAQAQDKPPVLVDIAACIDIAADTLRHACFDALAYQARTALQNNDSAAVPAEAEPADSLVTRLPAPAVPESAKAAAVATFGTSTSAGTARIESGAEGRQELLDRILDLEEREPGRWLITLESGQVWYQSNSGRVRLRKNMEVRIYPSPLGGSYRLAGTDSASTGFIQVNRVR